MQGLRPWYLYLILMYSIWAWLLFTGPGLHHYIENWPIALVMIFGSAVAGFTPEGGGAIAYPILSIWFTFPSTIARDFSLAIQAIGMTSASIYILASRRRSWNFYRHVPLYVLLNILGLIIGLAHFGSQSSPFLQMFFVSLALAFITAFWSVKRFGDKNDFDLNNGFRIVVVGVMCFFGGIASSAFGTGADMLLFVCLSCWFGMKEKAATDISILVMAAVSIIGILIRMLLQNTVDPVVYAMWLAAVPMVLLGAPLGNWLLTKVNKESMLGFLLMFNAWTFAWWNYKNLSYIWIAIPVVCAMYVTMSIVMLKQKHNQVVGKT